MLKKGDKKFTHIISDLSYFILNKPAKLFVYPRRQNKIFSISFCSWENYKPFFIPFQDACK